MLHGPRPFALMDGHMAVRTKRAQISDRIYSSRTSRTRHRVQMVNMNHTGKLSAVHAGRIESANTTASSIVIEACRPSSWIPFDSAEDKVADPPLRQGGIRTRRCLPGPPVIAAAESGAGFPSRQIESPQRLHDRPPHHEGCMAGLLITLRCESNERPKPPTVAVVVQRLSPYPQMPRHTSGQCPVMKIHGVMILVAHRSGQPEPARRVLRCREVCPQNCQVVLANTFFE